MLSRAFRNRFVELHFDELPTGELETILHQRCSLPPSYCTKLVKVMQDLQVTTLLYVAVELSVYPVYDLLIFGDPNYICEMCSPCLVLTQRIICVCG